MKSINAAILLLVISLPAIAADKPEPVNFSQNNEVNELRQLLEQLREDYESRISYLEKRLEIAEQQSGDASLEAREAVEIAEQIAIDQSSGSSSPNAFNPAIGVIFSGTLGDVDTEWEVIPGFQPAGEIGSGGSGYALGEAEVNLKSSIDANFYGNLTVAFAEGEVEVEEAWIQTTSLPAGLTIKGGRLFSSAGYLNSIHAHADDFADRPLPYQAFLGTNYKLDGLQASWIAPTELFVEVGAELDWGDSFPATGNGDRSPGTKTLFAKLGGDIGFSNSWLIGAAQIRSDASSRGEDASGVGFSGDSDLSLIDFVWKWAPNGNSRVHSLKFQGELFQRSETGTFDGIAYDGDQSGWYLQTVWQFAPRWRAGFRYDTVAADSTAPLDGTAIEDPHRDSRRSSVMFDYSPSEFSRIRFQYARDHVLPDSDRQWVVQYIMSMGAHGAHQF